MNDEAWHLDKKVPLGLILGLALNAFSLIWFASKLDSRVTTLELRDAVTTSELAKMKENADGAKDRLIRLEDKLENILEELKKIDARMALPNKTMP